MDYTAHHMSVWDSRRLQPLPKTEGLLHPLTWHLYRPAARKKTNKKNQLCPSTELCGPKRLFGPSATFARKHIHTHRKQAGHHREFADDRCVFVYVCGWILVRLMLPAENISPLTQILAQAQKQR